MINEIGNSRVEYSTFANSSKFKKAALRVVSHKNYRHNEMMVRLEKYGDVLSKCSQLENYVSLLCAIYNRNRRKENFRVSFGRKVN